MDDLTACCAEIITGLYKNGSAQQQELVGNLFGLHRAEEWYEIYFHWYNVIHELGHALFAWNMEQRPTPVEEEQLVNDFAMAYWRYYGEEEKLSLLEKIVSDTLPRFTRPAAEGVGHLDYANENWGKEGFYTFNNYGWFQFNCVTAALKKQTSLMIVLQRMGGVHLEAQPKETLHYIPDERLAATVIEDAAPLMVEWGMKVPVVRLAYSNDLNEHMCNIVPL